MISAALIDCYFLSFEGMILIGLGIILIGVLIGIIFDDPFGISLIVALGLSTMLMIIGGIFKYYHPVHNVCEKCTYITRDSLLDVSYTYPDGSPKVIIQKDYKQLKPECPNAKEGDRIDFEHKYITSIEVKTLPPKN